MKLHITTLRRIIRESISESHKSKLWQLFKSGPAGYRQAYELWDTMDPDGCPFPEPEKFFGQNDEPIIFEVFSNTVFALEDPYYFNDYCSAGWEDGMTFWFNFPFVCGDEDSEFDFGMGEAYFVVPGTNREQISRHIESTMEEELEYFFTKGGHTIGSEFWNNWKSIEADVEEQKQLTELGNGFATVYVRY